ncbi:MAG: hypothetical protein JWO67_1308, partial [Streptosporangiaceae bacterium]|nr:hypothetical protein [Streptosporangiaceae bacterium]
PTSNDESGRGLALLSALSADWGSAPTATGKVVWCRLTPGPLGVPATRTRHRIQRATAALEAYGRTTGGGADLLSRSAPIREELATVLIADLLHWLSVQGVGTDPDEILDRAQTHFEAVSGKA